ncbi:hypothetical protein J4433_03250 [Candidatus Pacearchaeota archaeon]|nr:hypothetical protein [Candidatus Pacearchaeota archaeon]
MKKSKIVLDWDEIETKKQKKGLIDAVLSEIALLRNSPALKDVISDDGISIAEIDRSNNVDDNGVYTLRILKTGKIVEDNSYMESDGYFSEPRYKGGMPVSKSELAQKIEFYKITPNDIRTIQKRIKR